MAMNPQHELPVAQVRKIIQRHGAQPGSLLQILREVQECCDWISPEAVGTIARELCLPRLKIEAVASFYSFLYLQPRGRYRVLFSDNITDRMAGSEELLVRMCARLWVEKGKVSEDGLVSVDTTSCTGMCDQGPGMLINNYAVTNLSAERIDAICDLIIGQVPISAWPAEFFRVEDNIRRRDMLLDSKASTGAALRAAMGRGAEATLQELQQSGLRGRGGAGFHTATKWASCRNAPGDAHYVVCNADEGEPGTFKDRVLLRLHADAVIEGMTVCAWLIGAHKGFLYLRGEYRYLLDELNQVLERRRAQGLLGSHINGCDGFDFDVEIHMGAGAYVCGEESALIESLEGKRGTPRNRPPYPVTHGYLGQPTVVNNVETFVCCCAIAQHGGAWFAQRGTRESTGSKLLSVSGDCERPGIYEFPFGVTVREVLDACGAHATQAVQISGPAGVTVCAEEFSRRIAFEDLPTAGAFMVFDQSRDMFDVARNFVDFFKHESCGLCTPCRVGTSLLSNLMGKLDRGRGSPYDFAEIQKLNGHLQALSHCGLGHSACNPVLDTLAKFRPTYAQRLVHHEYVPAFDLDHALASARQMTGRDDTGAHFKDE